VQTGARARTGPGGGRKGFPRATGAAGARSFPRAGRGPQPGVFA